MVYTGSILEFLSVMKITMYASMCYIVFASRVYLLYNTAEQVFCGIIQGIFVTLIAYAFFIGPSEGTVFYEFFGEIEGL